MIREQLKVGMKVLFGRPNGEKTLGEVIAVNPKKAKVKTLEGRGVRDQIGAIWHVPFSLMCPAPGGETVAIQSTPRPSDIVRLRLEGIINQHGLDRVIETLKTIAGKEAL